MGMLGIIFNTKNKELYALLERLGTLVREAGNTFLELAQDLPNSDSHAKKLHDIEHKGDGVVSGIFSLLDSTFFLAFDHEDIKLLAQSGDRIIDELWRAANYIGNVCRLRDADPQLLEVSTVLNEMCSNVEGLLGNVKRLKHIKNILEVIVRIHEQESVVDVLRDLVCRNRFAKAQSLRAAPIDVVLWLAWKDVYEHLDLAANACEDVADILSHFTQKY